MFTAQIDQRIREIYFSHPNAKARPGIRHLAEQVGIPHWALKKRARELGLARTKEKPWSEPELAILARYAWMSDERIRLKLKAAGYAHTVTGIHSKLKRMRFKCDPNFYSGKGLAQARHRFACRRALDQKRPPESSVSRNRTGRAAGW